MKKFSSAFVSGIRSASSSIRIVFVLYLFNLVIALPLALVFRGIMAGALGDSILAGRLLSGFDATVYEGFLRNGGKALGALTSVVGWTALFSMILSTVLDGGILGQLSSGDRRFTLASFFADCGRYLWRYIRLTLIFAPLLIIVFLLSTALFGSIYGSVDRNAVSEVGVFWTQMLIIAATLFLLGLVILMSDYARVETARSGTRSMIRASWNGVKFVSRRFFSVVGLQIALLVVSTCVIAAYLLAENAMSVSTGIGILVLLVLQQLTIILRMFIRVATFAGERHLYLSVVAPHSDSFPEVMVSSTPAHAAARPLSPVPGIPATPPSPEKPAALAAPPSPANLTAPPALTAPAPRFAPGTRIAPGTPPSPATLTGPLGQLRPSEPAVTALPRGRQLLRAKQKPRPRSRRKVNEVSRPASRRKVVRKKGKA